MCKHGTKSTTVYLPSLEGWPTKAKEAPSPHEVRLAPLDTNPIFQSLLESLFLHLCFTCNSVSPLLKESILITSASLFKIDESSLDSLIPIIKAFDSFVMNFIDFRYWAIDRRCLKEFCYYFL